MSDIEITVALSKDELPLYKYICQRFGFDHERYRSSRQLTVTPKHYAQLTVMCGDVNARRLAEQSDLSGTEATEAIDQFMHKIANQFKVAGENQEVVKFFEEHVDEDESAKMAEERELWGVLGE